MSNRRMTLRKKFLLHNLLLVGVMLIAGGVAFWRLRMVSQEVNVSHSVYAEMRTIGNVAVDVGTAEGLLSDPTTNRQRIIEHLKFAVGGLDQFVHVAQGYGPSGDPQASQAYIPINRSAATARNKLNDVLQRLLHENPASLDAASLRKTVASALDDIDHATTSCIGFISGRQQSASSELARTVIVIGLLASIAIVAAVLLSISQYRLVMVPLRRLREGVRRVAQAKFSQTVDLAGMGRSSEFSDLASEFNQMATELDTFYRRLEEQVREKSRELVRSERLASVGFLAAGVAHEINNPLNIISGYAEITFKRLDECRDRLEPDGVAKARENLRIIREEAFRCKEITEKLLSLSRPGDDSREECDLGVVARDVATMTQVLKNYRNRRLTLKLDSIEPLAVRANLTEMKQVLLNLTINALEAAPAQGGEVCIEGRRGSDWVELSVMDNGRGMPPEVLTHVFEPFFSARKTNGDRGTGLGLSISHAIVENHNGRIEAQSDGPGRGSRFTVRLPAMARPA